MKKILLILSILGCFAASAQKLQYVNTYGYEYNRFYARTLLGLPKDTFTVDASLLDIPWIAKKDAVIYTWNITTHIWEVFAGGGGSTVYVNAPLTKDVDTINIAEVSDLNDGYLSAGNFTKFDSLRNDWYRSDFRLYPANTGDTIIAGVPTTTLHKFNFIGNMHWTGDGYGVANRRWLNLTGQNVYFGSRSGNTASSGDAENTAVGELALGSITSGDNNTAFGKGAGFTLTTGSNNIFIGRNVNASLGAVTGSNNIAIGNSLGDPTASNQLNINTWLVGIEGRLGVGINAATFTPTATMDYDSAVGYAPIRLRAMAADPTTVNDGNIWHTNNHLYGRLNGATYQLDQQTVSGAGIDDVLALSQSFTAVRTMDAGLWNMTFESADNGSSAYKILKTTTGTNAVRNMLSLNTTTSNTAANGFGTFVEFNAESSAGSLDLLGTYSTNWVNATTASLESQVNITGRDNAATETFMNIQKDVVRINNNADTLETMSGARSRAETVTNKRNVKRVTTIVSSATPTPDGDASDMFTVTALAAGATFAAPTGTPITGQGLIIRIKDNGGAQTLNWNAIYRAGTDIALPTTTTAGKELYTAWLWNEVSLTWDLVSKVDGY